MKLLTKSDIYSFWKSSRSVMEMNILFYSVLFSIIVLFSAHNFFNCRIIFIYLFILFMLHFAFTHIFFVGIFFSEFSFIFCIFHAVVVIVAFWCLSFWRLLALISGGLGHIGSQMNHRWAKNKKKKSIADLISHDINVQWTSRA